MLPLTQKLAVGSFGRSIRIYDLASYELCGQVGAAASEWARGCRMVGQEGIPGW